MPESRDWLQVLAPATRFIFQGGPDARAAAGGTFGITLSDEPCRAHAVDGRAALWLGPDEHLLLGSIADAQALAMTLESALAGIAHSLVDVSQRQIALSVRGPFAEAILSTGCPLDLDAESFPAGACTRTLFAKADVVLWRRSAEEYHLEVSRSYSGYVLGLLREAGRSEIHECRRKGG